ncbi:class I SAM-dependent methyltransferase [Phosphitispora fastidiosa]|uniref:class I SAM-dependent methyltransferase n=1 Tax=Phosphitispora fastidiosa TaxID=2837202 RepID=UPI001E65020F|nr:class I SAM-dependent methyltransferase [Phosphitispora fastidiosa]MBU7008174.1 ubiquinone/menaquinone biosynthesis C-methylase UbiE [Phosphitispora fastidiosa]
MNIKNTQPSLLNALTIRNSFNHYNQWIYNKIKKFLGEKIMDVGSGTGNLVELFLPHSDYVLCTDLFPENIDYMKNRFKNNKNVGYILGDFVETDLCLEDYLLDTISCINVLEHIEEDYKALEIMKNILQPHGRIILLVPAFQFLYGTMDIASGHHRRYDSGVLIKFAEELHLKILDNFYFNIFGIIPWYINGKLLKKNKPYSETLGQKKIGLYNKVVPVLEKLDEFNPFPIGISEIIVLQKD